ncbi:MAG: hypothetical protein KME04_10535 [Pleurocapsa minor GSE-CHR-MK-17-07R]|nr:hypothetical protein [Pleurocapsa minor GSE-CHR-MK 17-07R]
MSAIKTDYYRSYRDVIAYHFPDHWTWGDFWDAKARSDAMQDANGIPVAVLMIVSDQIHLPDGAIAEARALLSHKHPLSNTVIVVSQNPLINATVKMISVLFARYSRIYVRHTAEEAEEFMRTRGFMKALREDADEREGALRTG